MKAGSFCPRNIVTFMVPGNGRETKANREHKRLSTMDYLAMRSMYLRNKYRAFSL
jgi:hypothetical protein